MTCSESRRRRAAGAINAQISAHREESLSPDLLSVFTSSDALEYLDDLLIRKGRDADLYLEIAVRFLTIGIHAGAAIEAADLLIHLHPADSE